MDRPMNELSHNPKLTVLFDNNSKWDELEAAWGFSCLVEGYDRTVLFDTGGHSPIFTANMATIGISPRSVDAVVLSHAHWDHVGGLEDFLRVNGDVEVYLLPSFPQAIKDEVRGAGGTVVEAAGPTPVCAGVTVTGPMRGARGPEEQAAILATKGGPVVITGCAHPGVVQIAEGAGAVAGERILGMIGGFHMYRHSDSRIKETISKLRDLGVRYAAPCHCSGDRAATLFEQEYGERFVECAAGAVIEIGEWR